ncbi:Adenine deaminase [Anatilimnocola aggregata]|uniref:Adenine deaminase n=1 Tax=Anatilimnocola aggregata TaxID=2528021 RepID=A0A517YDF9_9BACT|nr:adenine deaminase [Anatilimnocola aggregata]QDU28273.1 Adenine deaminase [Anatilimnocola aggregata]
MSHAPFRLVANVVDVFQERITPAEVTVADGRIAAIHPTNDEPVTYLTPGFVDAHVHVESSLLVPAEFARAAVIHGTVATVSDPHEIANVLGVEGVRYMLASAAQTPLKISFGASPCVPATRFETSGASIGVEEIASLLADDRIGYLCEMMNYPGVLRGDADVLSKIAVARQVGKPVDGHAPRVRGADAKAYFAAGISTDHECVSLEEALEKLALGVKILIREGSAARNFEALCDLLAAHSDRCMFCSDDLHPDSLVAGHIDKLVRRAVAKGYDPLKVLRCACLNPVEHYRLPVGLLRVGDPADFIELDNLINFRVLRTFINGRLVAEAGQPCLPSVESAIINHFAPTIRQPGAYAVPALTSQLRVIEAIDGELITRSLIEAPLIEAGCAVSDPTRDLLKLVVVNRYRSSPPAVAFIRGFGLQRGAIASSVAHDSHNIVAVGVDDESLSAAINSIMSAGGGLAVIDGEECDLLPLPVAGLMSTDPYEKVADDYSRLDRKAKHLGSLLRAPFMTLSFMALLVIPELKLSDLGLFDCQRGEFTSLFV